MLVAPFILGSLGPHAPPPSGGFPGQPGNPVGFAHAPGFTSLTTFSGSLTSGTSGSPQVYMFKDFNGGTSGTDISGKSWIHFIGCRFQSNSTENYCTQCDGSDHITFTYCSFVPLVSLYTSPPGGLWPSAGAFPNTPFPLTTIPDVNCIANSAAYQYGCSVNDTGPVTWDSCDFWGFGQNGPGFFSTTEPMLVTNCWIHDAAAIQPPGTTRGSTSVGYHTDGLGYQNGDTGPSNITVTGCTIASLGNTQALAFQDATGGYDNITIHGNYLSGYGVLVSLGVVGDGVTFTNSAFTNNVFGTDVQWWNGILYSDYTTVFSGSGNTWSGNTLSVATGSSPYPGSPGSGLEDPYNNNFSGTGESNPNWVDGDDGKFIWPDGTLHVTDF